MSNSRISSSTDFSSSSPWRSPVEISILPATLNDVADICDLEYQTFPNDSFNETTIANQLLVGGGVIASSPKGSIGYALLGYDNGLTDILRLGVSKQWRRMGVGTKLLKSVQDKHRCSMLCVRQDNWAALLLYMKLGFKIIGEYAQTPTAKSWVMLKTS